MFSCSKFCHKYDYNSLLYTRFLREKIKMLSDSDILEELDNILANDESGDEFLDDLCLDYDSGNCIYLFYYITNIKTL